MAEEQPSLTPAPAPAEAEADVGVAAGCVNLQILSPSVGVNTLAFPGLETSTTVTQLKEKIREILPLRPAGDQQRLIHRGRLLARDTETLLEVFGEEALRTGEQQTLHLVVRDPGDHDSRINTPSRATPVRGQSPAPGSALPRTDSQPQGQQPGHHHHHHHHQHQHGPHRAYPIRNGTPTLPNPYPMRNPTPGLPNPAVAQMMQLHQQLHQLHPQLNQHVQQQHQPWLNVANHLQREATYRQILAQQQRDRAAMGYHGVQDNGNGVQGQGNMDPGVEGIRRRVTPSEGLLPHGAGAGPTSNPGSRVQVTLPPAEILNVFRGADTAQATQTITNAMHRSASGASLAGMANLANPNGPIQPIQPGVTTPLYPGGSRYASRAATPDPSGRPASHVGGFAAFTSQQQLHPQPSHPQPEVYILSSPTGPRGLLVNNPSDMYITPAARPLTVQQQLPYFPAAPRPPYFGLPYPLPSHAPIPQAQPQNQPAAQPHQLPLPGQRQGQPRQEPPQAQIRIQRDFRVPARHGHPNNPGPGALMAAAWPHVWLIIRLVIFVWWFTSGDASWSRWIAMITIAIVVFLVNTGLIDGFVNQAWNPLRQHIEGLLPLGDANPPPQPGLQPPPPPPPAPGRDAPIPEPPALNPAEAAARLVARRRHDNANWLLDLARRLERAGLLFLASIAPGVAERHIAHLEAQERAAERQRRDEEEAEARAAADAAAAAAAATEAAGGNDQAHTEGESSTPSPPRQRQRAGSIEI